MGLRQVLTILLCLNALSCKEFQSHFIDIGFQCGVDPSRIDTQLRPWMIQGSHDWAQMTARFIGENRVSKPLMISTKGCVFAPAEPGVVQVLAPRSGLYASMQQQGRDRRGPVSLVLKDKYQLDISLLCPSEGHFSRGELPLPLQIHSQGSLEAVDLQLSVSRRGEKENLALVGKTFGLAELTSPINLLPPEFAEGDYDLHLAVENSMESWDPSVARVRETFSCPLTVHKRPPDLRGMPGSEMPIKQGEFLTVYAESPIPAAVQVCREKLADHEDQLVKDRPCVAQDLCENPKEFQPLEPKPVSDTGVFHYFFYAEDRAGNRSATQCQRLVVSESAPHLEVQWNNPAWNIPQAVMASADVTAQATIAISHPELSTDRLLKSLECKVDFTVAGKMTLQSSGVRCLSERCNGRDLSQWTPCDQHLHFSLSRFWAEEKAQRMAMHLHVRARAAEVQVEEAQKTIWIYPERFQPLPVNPSGFHIFEAADQSILLEQQGSHLLRFDEKSESWVDTGLSAITGDDPNLELAQDKNRDVYAVWKNAGAHGVALWKNKSWAALPPHPEVKDCEDLSFKAHPKGGVLCETKDSILMWYDQAWHKTDLPCLRIEVIAPPEVRDLLIKADGQNYLSCFNGSMFQRRGEDAWTQLDYPKPMQVTHAVLDKQERLWTLGWYLQENRQKLSIQYLEQGQWYSVEVPSRSGILEEAALSRSAAGDIRYGDAVWDAAQKQWRRPDDIQSAFPDLGLRSVSQDTRGELLQIFESDYVFRTAQGIHQFPLTSFDVTDLRDTPLFDSKGRLWLISLASSTVYRIDPLGWQTYAEEAGFTRNVRNFIYPKAWLNPGGQLEYFEQEVGLVQAGPDRWEQLFYAKIPGNREPLMEIKADKHGNAYGIDARQLYRFQPGKDAELVLAFPDHIAFIEGLDARGYQWIRQLDSRWVWMLDGNKPVPRPLPIEDKDAEDLIWYNYPEQLGVRAGKTLFLWDEAQLAWKESSYDSEGPFGSKPWDVAGPQHFVGWSGENRTLVHGSQVTPLPDMNGFAVFGEFKFIRNTLVYLSGDTGLYCFRDGQWQALMTEKMLAKRGITATSVHFTGMTLDSMDRLWVTGAPFRLLRMDLNDASAPPTCIQ